MELAGSAEPRFSPSAAVPGAGAVSATLVPIRRRLILRLAEVKSRIISLNCARALETLGDRSFYSTNK